MTNKLKFLLVFGMLYVGFAHAQVGIGTTTPASSSVLDLTATNKALVLPRVANVDAVISPINGMMVYDLQNNCVRSYDNNMWSACLSGATVKSSNGTAIVSGYTCSGASVGTMIVGKAVPAGVTQAITATVTAFGSYYISATANGVTFSGSGIFAGLGPQSIVLTASGTPTVGYYSNYVLDTTPNCSFSRFASVTGCFANIGGTLKDFLCYNLGVTATANSNPFIYDSGKNNGDLYQWGRQTDGHEKRSSLDVNTQATNDAATLPIGVSGKFIFWNVDPYNWRNPAQSALWGNGTTGSDPAKAVNDPCPSGYKVPSQAQWSGLYGGTGTPASATANTWTWTTSGYRVGSNLFLPAAGYRQVRYSTVFRDTGTNGLYWTSTISGTAANFVLFTSSSINAQQTNIAERGNGMPIRCIQEN